MSDNLPVEQPIPKGGNVRGYTPVHTVFQAGSARAVARLETLKFDPIGELVDAYHWVMDQIEIQEALRDGRLVEYKADGKPKAFFMDNLFRLMDKRVEIADKLLRYGYGRVPENAPDEKVAPPVFQINLTPKGGTYQLPGINDGDD